MTETETIDIEAKAKAEYEAYKTGKYAFEDYHAYEIESGVHKGGEFWEEIRSELRAFALQAGYSDEYYGADILEEFLYKGIEKVARDGPYARTVYTKEHGTIIGYSYHCDTFCIDCALEIGVANEDYTPADYEPERKCETVGVMRQDTEYDAPGQYCDGCFDYLDCGSLFHY